MMRLYRIIPLLILLAVIAAVVYVVMSFRYSSNHAKIALIKVFTVLNIVLSVLFLLITLYALFEQNDPVFELAGSCLITTLVGLAVTRICNYVFQKNHPNFTEDAATANFINPSLATRFGEAFKKAFGDALQETFRKK